MKHLRDVNEGYLEHAVFALKGAAQCMLAAGALVVHAAVPALFTTSASTRLRKLLDTMMQRYTK